MKLTATRIKEISDPKTLSDLVLNVTFVPSRITQQGVHRGEDVYPWDLFTFTRALPFTRLTGSDIESLEYRVTHRTPADPNVASLEDLELWELVK